MERGKGKRDVKILSFPVSGFAAGYVGARAAMPEKG